jgi:dihydroorotase|tara:strand:+ start:911 stop:2266 length:1356 start_codon:yes stop_codon:yes gene_type:complete
MRNIIIKNGTVLNPKTGIYKKLDIMINNGIIIKIEHKSKIKQNGFSYINAKGMIITPGFIDLHSHLREPGHEYKETIETGTASAAKGGFTTICAMPNTNPAIDNIRSLNILKIAINNTAVINVLPIGTITKSRKGKALSPIKTLLNNGIIALSDDGDDLYNEKLLKNALIIAKKYGIPLSQHCEQPQLVKDGHMHEGWVSMRLGLKGRSPEAEELMVKRDIKIAEEIGAHLHIAHISTKKSIQLVRNAKKRQAHITAEVTPHHLTLSHEDVAFKNNNYNTINYITNAKVNPPLREKEDIIACIRGLNDNTIDAIATDHAPHDISEKNIEFTKALPGMIGFESAFALGMDLVNNKQISFKKLIQKLTTGPAVSWQLNKIKGLEGLGKIEEGLQADLTIIDKKKKWKYLPDQIISKGKNSPFFGRTFTGKVMMTIYKGNIVYQETNSVMKAKE